MKHRLFPAAAALWLLAAGCGSGKPDQPLIGVLLPETDLQGQPSQALSARHGLELARAEMAAARGAALPYRFELRDNKSDLNTTIRLVSRFADRGASLVIGPVFSAEAVAAAKTARERKVPLLTPTATHPDVTSESNSYAFRACYLDTQQAQAMAHFARDGGWSLAVTVTDLGSAYSVDLSGEFERAFVELGGDLLGRFYFHSGQEELAEIVAAVAELQPEVVFLPIYAADVRRMLRASSSAWRELVLLGVDGWAGTALAPDELREGEEPPRLGPGCRAYIANHFAPEESGALARRFVDAYRAAHGGADPSTFAALTYDAALLAVAALDRAEDPFDPTKVRDALDALDGVEGVTGTLSFQGQGGNPHKSLVIQEVSFDGSGRASFRFVRRF